MNSLNRRAILTGVAALAMTPAAHAQSMPAFRFDSIDGGQYNMADWRGRPVLVVNTASQCAYTGQYDELQALHDAYGPRGLVVLAVPSDDFAQELESDAAVAEFCELNFNLTLPMTTITRIRNPGAHPFFAWLNDTHGIRPGWNFNKVLIGPGGEVVGHFGSTVRPMGRRLRSEIEALLPA